LFPLKVLENFAELHKKIELSFLSLELFLSSIFWAFSDELMDIIFCFSFEGSLEYKIPLDKKKTKYENLKYL